MCSCFGRRNKDEANAERSQELDKMLRADEKKMQKEVKLLLLGMAVDGPYLSRDRYHSVSTRYDR